MFKMVRAITSGLIGGVAWNLAMKISFWPAQTILANPDLQSEKFLSVFYSIEPLPRMFDNASIFTLGLLVVGIFYGLVYGFVFNHYPGSWFKKGVMLGLTGWALMVPWFEFYLPWNVMHEPIALVFLEGFLWMVVLQIVGFSIACSDHLITNYFIRFGLDSSGVSKPQ